MSSSGKTFASKATNEGSIPSTPATSGLHACGVPTLIPGTPLCKIGHQMHYFYILRSLKNNKLYLGSTSNLRRRIKEHNDGKSVATKPNIPYELMFYSVFKNKQDAIASEKYFKTTRGWERIHRMLKHSLSNS